MISAIVCRRPQRSVPRGQGATHRSDRTLNRRSHFSRPQPPDEAGWALTARCEPGQPRRRRFRRSAVGSQALMSVFADVKSRAAGLARAEKERYSGDQERPLGGYLTAMGAYVTVTGSLALAARLTRRQIPEGLGVTDVLMSAVATHKLSR